MDQSTGDGLLEVAKHSNCILNTLWGSIRLENYKIFEWSSIAKPDSFLTAEAECASPPEEALDKAFIAYNNQYGNHYHQLREWCLSIFIYYHHGYHDEGYNLVLPAKALGVDYQQNAAIIYTLDFLNIRHKAVFVQPGRRVKIHSCIYPRVLSGFGYTMCNEFISNCFMQLSEYILKREGFHGKKIDMLGINTYISRIDSPKRRLVNEAQLIDVLISKHRFQIATFSGLSLVSQIVCVRSSALIIAPHGAALSNLLFKQNGDSKIIEIMPEGYSHPFYSCISNTKSYTHHNVTAHTLTDNGDTHNSEYFINIPEILGLI